MLNKSHCGAVYQRIWN